jgi:tetratricopeptide (TPR) repeat protein
MVPRKLILISFLTLVFTACSTGKMVPLNPLSDSGLSQRINDISKNRLEDPFIADGFEALEEGNYVLASKSFNRALKFVPQNSQLHFLNGLTYHLMAKQGDSSQIEFAETGYGLALQFDSSNYWAAYLLGQIYYQKQEYRKAQDWFAYALLFEKNNPTLLHALASASYYAQDLKTANDAIDLAEKFDPQNSSIMRDTVLINAAVSQFDKADVYFDKYQESTGDPKGHNTLLLRKRLKDWKQLHEQNPKLQLAQSTSDIFGSSLTRKGIKPDKIKSSKKDGKKKEKLVKKDMVLVDVVIIRSTEAHTTGKGVNLLNGLSLTFGGNNLFTVSDVDTDNFNAANTNVRTTTFNSPTINMPSVTYSLNMFNDNDDRNEVLARPTLVGLDGEKSEFFSGAVVHVALAGASGSEGTVETIPIGLKLEITHKFIDKNTVELNVEAARAFVDSVTQQSSLGTTLQVTKTFISANVAMNFGQTLVLSGISEKETESRKDGVPFLQSIPGIQYLFSREDTVDFTKSVIILVTPRKPRYTHGDGSDKVDPQDPNDMDSKQSHLKEWIEKRGQRQPAPNLDAAYYHLQNRKLYKEFRTGDVTLETWSSNDRLQRMLERSIEFLYY